MDERPSAPELLAAARDALLDELLPLLPADHRLDALVVAEIMAIAAREIEAGDAPLAAELARLRALYAEEPSTDETALQTAEHLSRRLAADLRAGTFEADPARLAEARRHLVETTLAHLRINNPRYLESG